MNAMQQLAAREAERHDDEWGDHVEQPLRRKSVQGVLKPIEMFDLSMMVSEVSEETGISVRDILGDGRPAPVARARQEAYARARDMGLSLCAIGSFFARDHTTISYALQKLDRATYGKNEMILSPGTKNEIAAASALAQHDDEMVFSAIAELHQKLLPIRVERVEKALKLHAGHRVRMAMDRLECRGLIEPRMNSVASGVGVGCGYRLTEAGKAKAGVV